MSCNFTAAAEADNREKVLIVVSNTCKHPKLGLPMGFWSAGLTHPYAELLNHNIDVTIASIDGGEVTFDDYSDPRHESRYSEHDLVSLAFINSPEYSELLRSTVSISSVDVQNFDAIIVVGGQATMYTFRQNETLKDLILAFFESGKPTAALCHGVSALMDIRQANGSYLIDGKTITGFSKAEDDFADQTIGVQYFDWWIEPTAVSRGANYVQGGMWADFATSDGNLITGQQYNSGASVAQMVIEQLSNQVCQQVTLNYPAHCSSH